jgi:hypothetical protein
MDKIYLRNGLILHGHVIERKLKYVKIACMHGSVVSHYTLPMAGISHVNTWYPHEPIE